MRQRGEINGCIVSKNKEIITTEGSIYSESNLFICSNENVIELEIKTKINPEKNILFPFLINKDFKYELEVSYTMPKSKTYNLIKKSRKFFKFSQISFNKSTIDCVVIEGKERYEANNSFVEYDIIEYFGLGVGLVRSEKSFDGNKIVTSLLEINK